MPTAIAIREQVERIIIRANLSEQQGLLVRYIVEELLAGREPNEISIAKGFFGQKELELRPASGKSRPSDTRGAMRRLRGSLETYYAGVGSGDRMLISIPPRSFVPLIRGRFDELSEQSRRLLRRAGEAREKRSAGAYSEVIRLYKQIDVIEGKQLPLVLGRLAEIHALRVVHSIVPPRPEMAMAREYAMKALADREKPWPAYVALGAYEADINWDWAKAEEAFAQAIKLGGDQHRDQIKNSPWSITLYNARGRGPELIEFLEDRMSEVDDTGPLIRRNLGTAMMLSGRFDDALREYEAAFPHYLAHAYQTMIYDAIGEPDKALEQARIANEKPDSQFRGRGILIMALAKAGKHKEAREELSSLESRSEYIGRFELAVAHMGFADYNAVLDQLERAAEEREYLMLFLPHWPMFRPLHQNKRFLDLVDRMTLPRPRTVEN
jgi:tetratricopeptide (TPR) repeat protein